VIAHALTHDVVEPVENHHPEDLEGEPEDLVVFENADEGMEMVTLECLSCVKAVLFVRVLELHA